MVFRRLRKDIRAIMERDPAAKVSIEVLLSYPGLHALVMHRHSPQLLQATLVCCCPAYLLPVPLSDRY